MDTVLDQGQTGSSARRTRILRNLVAALCASPAAAEAAQGPKQISMSPSPPVLTLIATPGGLEIDLTLGVTDPFVAPVTQLKLAKGVNRSTMQALTPADYSSPPAGVHVFSFPPTTTSYVDLEVSEGVHYYYRLMACDGSAIPNCGQTRVVQGDAGPVLLSTSFGAQELIFDAPGQACPTQTGFDIADVPTRAVRRGDGSIYLASGNSRGNFYEEGPNFNSLTRNCLPPAPMDSNFDPNPAEYDYQRWIMATYREPNSATPNRIWSIVHHEYHDHDHVPPCPVANNGCIYTGLTLAYSDNGGRSWAQSASPSHLIAELPYPWDHMLSNDPGVRMPQNHGYAAGSNIIKHTDGYYYALTTAVYDPLNVIASSITSMMRTNDLSNAQSWRFWDGTGFNHQTRNPYVNGVSYATAMSDIPQYIVGAMDSNLKGMATCITRNTYLGMYMTFGALGDPEDGVPCGFYYAVSHDLVHWSRPRLFRAVNLPWCNMQIPQDVYPTVIDHSDASPNFENTDNQFYLYYIHYITTTDRDLMRVPVTITRL